MMTASDWKKYGKHLSDASKCHFCGKYINRGDESVTYVKTRSGSHLFVCKACASLKGGKR